ncbi:hypothetical protein E4T56_gene20997, partial [Termitomyces sp. T112]
MLLGAFAECLPYAHNRVTLDYKNLDPFGLPQTRIDFAYGENEARLLAHARDEAKAMLGLMDVDILAESADPGPGGSAVHEMGGARMGHDPATSVLNAHNQAHDIANLFITDGAAMASSACQNPSLTYMGLTARAAAYAAEQGERPFFVSASRGAGCIGRCRLLRLHPRFGHQRNGQCRKPGDNRKADEIPRHVEMIGRDQTAQQRPADRPRAGKAETRPDRRRAQGRAEILREIAGHHDRGRNRADPGHGHDAIGHRQRPFVREQQDRHGPQAKGPHDGLRAAPPVGNPAQHDPAHRGCQRIDPQKHDAGAKVITGGPHDLGQPCVEAIDQDHARKGGQPEAQRRACLTMGEQGAHAGACFNGGLRRRQITQVKAIARGNLTCAFMASLAHQIGRRFGQQPQDRG